MATKHWPNHFDAENQTEPENVILIPTHYEDATPQERMHGWRLLLAWVCFIGGSALTWYLLGWCAFRGIERAGR